MITTHVLDTSRGKPAAGIDAVLEWNHDDTWNEVGKGTTDADGRIKDLVSGEIQAGRYRLTFRTGGYFSEGFYPEVMIQFHIQEPKEHYHVPLLLSPFGYSTYRGS